MNTYIINEYICINVVQQNMKKWTWGIDSGSKKFASADFAIFGGGSSAGRDFRQSHSVAVSSSDPERAFHLDRRMVQPWKFFETKNLQD